MTNEEDQNPELVAHIKAQRKWLQEYKHSSGFSWSILSQKTGIPFGTISQFGGKNGYNGLEGPLADKIQRYRDKLVTQHAIRKTIPVAPGYFSTTTSEELIAMLNFVQRGAMAAAAMGAGTGKTMTAKHYQACYPNVWIATITPTSSSPNTMLVEVLRALSVKDVTGTPQKLSAMVKEIISETGGVLIIDECQHLSTASFEEIRSWYDETGIGIALFGNYSMMARIEGINRRSDFAQIYSRLGLTKTLPIPLPDDALALADMWGFEDKSMRDYIVRASQMPGGLRGVTNMIKLASMFAENSGSQISLAFLKDAQQQATGRTVAS